MLPSKTEDVGIPLNSEIISRVCGNHLGPTPGQTQTMLVELQRKTVRCIKNAHRRTFSVTTMLQSLQLGTLEEGRKVSRFIFMFKTMGNHVAVPMADLGLERNPRVTRGLATQAKLALLNNVIAAKYSARTMTQWNRLPQSTSSADQYLPSKISCLGRHNPQLRIFPVMSDLGLSYTFRFIRLRNTILI